MTRSVLLLVALAVFASGPVLTQELGYAPYGGPSCGSGRMPTFHTAGEVPILGNANFRLVSENLPGGAPGLLFVSDAAANIPLLNLSILVDPLRGHSQFVQADGQMGLAGAGRAIAPLRIPYVPFLVDGKLFFQGFFFDAGAPHSLVHTGGLEVTILLSTPPELYALRDRLAYLAYFTGVTPTLAGQLGRMIWAANQVPGFSYLRRELFSEGGESHWMVILLHDRTGLEFSLIPGGNFLMGDIAETGWPDERPVRFVTVRPFLLARTVVTQKQFTDVMTTTPWIDPQHWGVMVGPDYPASYVDWADVTGFNTQVGFRLPTEAEWEYACRAGSSACFNHGENYPPSAAFDNYAWHAGNAWNANPPQRYAHQVGQKLPNAFGLFDMHGNVWEWCADTWHADYSCAPIDGRAWIGASTHHLARGGSFSYPPRECSSASRFSTGLNPAVRRNDLGFRPAVSLSR